MTFNGTTYICDRCGGDRGTGGGLVDGPVISLIGNNGMVKNLHICLDCSNDIINNEVLPHMPAEPEIGVDLEFEPATSPASSDDGSGPPDTDPVPPPPVGGN